MKAKEDRNAANNAVAGQPAAQPAKAAAAAPAPAEKAPIKMPDPIRPPTYPELSNRIDIRFQLSKSYPYSTDQRNVFIPKREKTVQIIPQFDDVEPVEIVERPDISYHGFFSLGTDKIAILKSADELLLTKVGTMLRRSPFKLGSVFPDHVVLIDTTEASREFQVALSENTPEGGN
jgi:hypothetical protein